MGKRGPESYMKRQKEIKRMQKAQEKIARRRAKKTQGADIGQQETDIQQMPDMQQPTDMPQATDI